MTNERSRKKRENDRRMTELCEIEHAVRLFGHENSEAINNSQLS